jgi:predicted ATPase
LEQLQQIVRSRKLALIEGEAGIGKSRLIDQFIRSTIVAKSTANGTNQPDQPPLMLFGQARELEQAFPYHPLIEALRQLVKHATWPVLQRQLELAPIWLQEISRLLPELGATPLNHPVPRQAADESRLWEAVWQFLQAVARHRRLLVALDDLQWADATTLGLLGYLIRQAAATNRPISFIAATRPTLPRSPLAILSETLVRENRLERLSLQPLTPADIADLSRHLITKADDTFTDWLTRTSEGNPLFLDALVSYARENNILDQNGLFNAAALPDSPPVPDTVYTLIQSRLIRLSEAAQRVLNAAVAVGREFEFDVVARAAALSDSAALDALDELRAARLVHPIDDGLSYSFDHNLTMEVAWREVGEPRHRLLHRRVGEALENLYRDRLDSVAGQLAQRFAEGNAPERATRYAIRAGNRAADLAAWSEAVSF